ncbi:MAG: methylenetetrahydrofolate reductase C-terminal domain-containing protein [Clostridiales bacterium]|nr:methylenetetrahydrofolate reductase C-terminal domain-containing protein [Clostridiales bacterium]
MLMTKLKSKDEILSLTSGSFFVINCHGCKEVGFPEEEAKALEKALMEAGRLAGTITTDYVCNPTELTLRLRSCLGIIGEADAVLVLSCGVGVQTVAEYLEDYKVFAACDTIELPGFQGVTPLEYDCGQCGECFLNLTGGICPITACSKSLVNGPCGGTSDSGKCEVCPDMECGWERIIQRLKAQGRLDVLKCPTQLHDFNTDEATKAAKESE